MRVLQSVSLTVLVVTTCIPLATAGSDNKWAKVRQPKPGPAVAIGGYSAGCVGGARALPVRGKGYTVVRPQRKKHFGHPKLIKAIVALAAAVARNRGHLLIGDLGQPRGGPSPNGHASHQNGLDVDIYFWQSKPKQRPRTTRQRKAFSAPAIVHPESGEPSKHWSPHVATILRLAAKRAEVARIFVNPGIKRQLCKASQGDRDWLRKLRPWWGHAAHFHMRLQCPADSPDCKPQSAIEKGDGCAEIDWWYSADARQTRAANRQKYQDKVASMPDLPAPCEGLL